MKFIAKISGLVDTLINSSAFLAALLIVITGLGILAEIIMRFFFRRPIKGITELSEYSLLFITFLAAAWVLKRDGHVAVDLLLNRLKPRTRLLVNLVTSIASSVICLVLVWFGTKSVIYFFESGYLYPTPLRPPAGVLEIIIPLGFLLLFSQLAKKIQGYVQKWKAPNNQARMD
ncbi:MAG: TRAP transporter small permease [Chloroflexi bacterium]|nr:TRAP transporter small permease [Chloroflexota bacterium]